MTRYERVWTGAMRLILADPPGSRRRLRRMLWVGLISGGCWIGFALALGYWFNPIAGVVCAVVGGYLLRFAENMSVIARFTTFAPRYLKAEALDPPPAP